MKRNNFQISDFYCTECGKQGVSLPRCTGERRKGGHLKKLYCLHCQKETNFVEITAKGFYDYETFLIEFNSGNFVNGKRKYTIKQCLSKEAN